MAATMDAPDFEAAAAFHGHLCPGLAIGYRVAKAALEHLAAERAEDEELVAIVENDSCAAGAVQVLTGCKFGKGNFFFRDYGRHVYTFLLRPTGKGVRVRVLPRPAEEDEAGEADVARARRIEHLLAAVEEEILAVEHVTESLPERATIHESAPCEVCGQPTMVTRLRDVGGRRLCIPCAKAAKRASER